MRQHRLSVERRYIPSKCVSVEVGARIFHHVSGAGQQRNGTHQLPELCGTDEPVAAGCDALIQHKRHPERHAAGAAVDAAGSGRQRGFQGKGRFKLAVRQHVRRCIAGVGSSSGQRRRAIAHAQRVQQALLEKILERHAGDAGDHLSGNDVEQIVVGELRAKARVRLQVAHREYDVVPRAVGLREQQEIARTDRQPAAMRQQIANREFPRDPRIMHAKFRQVIDHRFVPADLALIDEYRQRGCSECLGYRCDLEQRFIIDRIVGAGLENAVPRGVNNFAAMYDRDRHAGHAELLHRAFDRVLDRRLGRGCQ